MWTSTRDRSVENLVGLSVFSFQGDSSGCKDRTLVFLGLSWQVLLGLSEIPRASVNVSQLLCQDRMLS